LLECSSGTYVRTLAQDFGRFLGSLGYVRELQRVGSGSFSLDRALPLATVFQSLQAGTPMHELSCAVPFDGLMAGLPHAELSTHELGALLHGRYAAIQRVAHRISWGQGDYAALFYRERLRGVVRLEEQTLRVENVFRSESP
jgi:tRNA pseudouridine55 synthase